jgi:MFS transporter, FHS family, glucose/mannose:H+ symporter
VGLSDEANLESGLARRGLAGFFLSGRTDFQAIAHYFFSLNAGILIAARYSSVLLSRRGIAITLTVGCILAFAGMGALSAAAPPVSHWWRVSALLVVGLAIGLLHTGIFHLIMPAYQHDPVATVNIAGIFFGLGCLVTALLVAGTFYIYTVGSIVFLLAVVPAFFAGMYAKSRFRKSQLVPERSFRDVLHDFSHPAAVLFALVLFFQFGNEWALAGWLPLFLIQRLGISPAASLLMLSVYWAALLVGRIAAQAILARVSHARLLMLSVLSAWLGCGILWMTNNTFGATVGILLIGCGFAPIYPLVVERIGNRFPYYHPGFFNGIFSLAFTGGLLAPGTLGYFADSWGIGAVAGLPLLGSGTVLILLLVLWLEAKLSGLAGVGASPS